MDFTQTKRKLSAINEEGTYLTLVTCVSAFPEEGDASLVFRIAEKTTRLIVKYEVVVALSRLYELSLLSREEIERALYFTSRFKFEGNEALESRIRIFENDVLRTRVA